MEYTFLLFDALSLVLLGAVTMTVLWYAIHALICVLAWIEDEAERAVRRSRRRARLRERARRMKAGVEH